MGYWGGYERDRQAQPGDHGYDGGGYDGAGYENTAGHESGVGYGNSGYPAITGGYPDAGSHPYDNVGYPIGRHAKRSQPADGYDTGGYADAGGSWHDQPAYRDPGPANVWYEGQAAPGRLALPPAGGYPESGYRGDAYPGGNAYPDGAYPGNGAYPDSAYPGNSGYPDNSAYPDGGYAGSAYPDGAYPDSAYPGSAYPDSAYPDGAYPDNGAYPNNSAYPDNSAYPEGTYPGNGYPGDQMYSGGGNGTGGFPVAVRDPVRGYPPSPLQLEAGSQQGVAQTGQQPQLDQGQYGPYRPGQYSPQGQYDVYASGPQPYQDYEVAGDNGFGYDNPGDYYPGPGQFPAPAQQDFGTSVDLRAGRTPDPRTATRFDLGAADAYGAPAGFPEPGGYQGQPNFGGQGNFGGGQGGPRALAGPARRGRPPSRGEPKPKRRLPSRIVLLSAAGVVLVAAAGFGGYKLLVKNKAGGNDAAATQPLPSAGAKSTADAQCAAKLGQYCHIETRTDDPTPLTIDELYPAQFANTTDKGQFVRAGTRLDTTCSSAVVGASLVAELQTGHCNQVLRASYVSGDGKVMGTIGVVNLATTNEAHDAGKLVGASNFIAPLTASQGPAAKLGQGTGVVEAEFKGHYLILTWAQFANLQSPTTTAQQQQLEQFESDLITGTANIVLSQRMVSGSSGTARASASASAKAG